MSHRFRALCTAWLLLGLAACGQTPNNLGPPASPSPAATRTPASAPVVAGSFTPAPGTIYFGAYVNPSGLAKGFAPGDVASFEQQINRTLTLHLQYLSFTANFAGNLMTDDYVHYRVPVVSWNCQFPSGQVASGAIDTSIEAAALAAKSFSGPMFLRYMWDPNLPATEFARTSCWDPRQGDFPNDVFSPAQYIKAYRHIVSIFRSVGATNVIFLWTVSADSNAFEGAQYYPGGDVVDWVGMDAYDLTNGTPAQTYSPLYSQLVTLQKPIMVSENGAVQSIQPAYFSSVASTLQSQFPQVKAWCYYDAINYNGQDNADWRIGNSSWTSFISLANNPYMQGTYVP